MKEAIFAAAIALAAALLSQASQASDKVTEAVCTAETRAGTIIKYAIQSELFSDNISIQIKSENSATPGRTIENITRNFGHGPWNAYVTYSAEKQIEIGVQEGGEARLNDYGLKGPLAKFTCIAYINIKTTKE